MSTANLALVTGTLRRVLDNNMRRIAGATAPAIDITCGYPEDQTAATRTVNLHLYHVAEDQFRRNLPGPGNDRRNVSTTPLALTLYYIMTAHHSASDVNDWEIEQQIMGYALKTLHDFPTIHDGTQVLTLAGPEPALIAALRNAGNVIDVIFRPLTPEDALAFWSAEQEQPVRLSAHYEVRTVLMDPDPPRSSPGIVYAVGQTVAPRFDLALTATAGEVAFARPAAVAGSLPGSFRVSPARPALDNPPSDPLFPDNARFTITGSGFTAGLARRLVVRSDRWRAAGVPRGEIAIAPGPGQPGRWALAASPERLDVEIGATLDYADAAGAAAVAPVLPGHYRVALEIVTGYRSAGTTMRELTQRSNELAITISPRILRADPPVVIPGVPGDPPPGNEARSRIAIVVGPDAGLNTGGNDPAAQLDIRLVIDGVAYERAAAFDPVPANNDGRFVVAAADRLTLQPVFDTAAPGLHGVRLSVEGADAQPFWIET